MKKSQLRAVQIGGVGLVLLAAGLLYYIFSPRADTQPPAVKAFPTAEGFGASTVGGRGGQVIEVTNLLDRIPDAKGKLVAAPGSLRAAIETKGPRIVVFRVSGNIDLGRSIIKITEPYLTIAGHTAPGDGITIKNGWLPIQTHDIVLRHIRVRPGPGGYESTRPNGASANVIDIGTPAAYNIVFDHTSISWGTDENFSVRSGAKNVTIQNSVISEAMHCVPPPFSHSDSELCHSKNILMYAGATEVTFYRNLFAHAIDRNPLIMSGDIEFVNNVTYNYGGPLYIIPRYTLIRADIIGNAYRAGVNSLPDRPSKHEIRLHDNCAANVGDPEETCFGEESAVYLDNNLGTDTPTGPFRPARALCPDNVLGTGACIMNLPSTPHFDKLTKLPVEPVESAYTKVLASAGATIPKRDAVDERVANDVRNGTGRVINQPSEVGGWPELQSTAAPTDTDKDGMPDAWETKHGLEPSNAADASHDGTKDGYTNIEKYLNELAKDIDYGDQQFETFIKPDLEPSPEVSVGPMTSPSPTESPALDPTPSPTPSPVPSAVPSTVPSTAPSTAPSAEPSSTPSPEPSVPSFGSDTSPVPTVETTATTQPTSVIPVPAASSKSAAAKSSPKAIVLPKLVESGPAPSQSPNPTGTLRPLIVVNLSGDEDKKTSPKTQSQVGGSFVSFIQNLFAGLFSWFSSR